MGYPDIDSISVSISICHDDYNDIVYIVGNKGDVHQYEIKINEWKDWDLKNWIWKIISNVIR